MHFGDQIGSLTVVGYAGASGGHLVSYAGPAIASPLHAAL
jgi:hypothetical protein